MTAPRILLLEAAGPESGAIAATAAASGYQVHAVTDPTTHAAYDTGLRRLLSGCLLTNFTHPDRALDDIVTYARRHDIGALLTTNEYLTELLAHACAALGLPGNGLDRAHAARNKVAMAEAFAAHSVTAPHTRILGDENELHTLFEDGAITFPCVVKPADMASSAGVTIVNGPAEAAAAWPAAWAPRGMYGMPRDPRVLVQDCVVGTEYSVESLTQHGITTHLCVTRKTITGGAHRVEIGHGLPADLPPGAEHAVHREVEKAINAVGIRNGASHTEIMLLPDHRVVVIEIGARLGAGQIGFLIQHALGINPWTALLDIALGRPAATNPTLRGYATVRFLTSPCTGRLVAVSGLPERGVGVPAVRLRAAVGDMVDKTRANGQRLGSFVVTGPHPADVEARANALAQQVRIDVAPCPDGEATPT